MQAASKTGGAAGAQVFTAPADASRSVALADGTSLTLAPDAQARVILAAERRQLFLDRGSITLAVMHDASRPFRVAALDRSIVDIGTRFQVALEDGAMRVALFEGSVRVEGGIAPAVLRPGEQLVARPGKRDVITRIAAGTAGQPELVQFDNVTLTAAAATINQSSQLKLVVPEPKVAALRISGRFRAGEPERFARTVSDLLGLRVVRVGPDRIELRRAR